MASGPVASAQQFGGELALSSQLVDRGLAITPATPILQGAMSWSSPGGWSVGVAGGVELRSPRRPVLVIGRVSRAWVLPGDWTAQASLLHYDYRSDRGVALPDRADASLAFTWRDLLTVGVSAVRPMGGSGDRVLGAADLSLSYPLARRLSLSAGAGYAQARMGKSHYGGYPSGGYRPGQVRGYGYGSLGLAWSSGRMRVRVDRHLASLGDRRVYGVPAAEDWAATVSWAF